MAEQSTVSGDSMSSDSMSENPAPEDLAVAAAGRSARQVPASVLSSTTVSEAEQRKQDVMHSALREVFGFDDFRPGQSELISAILDRRDVVGVLPTGAGKSLCYELPAIMLRGLTLVITPLISLMKDQVDGLNKANIPAAFVNSTMGYDEEQQVLRDAEQGRYRILYVAPERLNNPRFLDFACNRVPLPFVAVDEAHCVSQWGQDFRPAYLEIPQFIAQLPRRPIVAAFTATATPKAREDIAARLQLNNPCKVMTTFDRPNLTWSVERAESKAARTERIVNWAVNHAGESGIVYCSTRAATEEVSESLRAAGISACAYHGGMEAAAREEAQDAFINNSVGVIVATNAFGMGIDKPDVRWVLHHNAPENIEAYYQEAGRAGRDGLPAQCMLVWMEGDFNTSRHFIETGGNDSLSTQELETVRQHRRGLLESMHAYCMTTDCLRNVILDYFGEKAHDDCGRCSNCAGQNSEIVDVSDAARTICDCLVSITQKYDYGFGAGKVVAVLRGSGAKELENAGLTSLPQFGALSDHSDRFIRDVISQLVSGEYLFSSGGRFPTMGLGPRFRQVHTDGFSLMMKQERKSARTHAARRSAVRRGAVPAGMVSGVGTFEGAGDDGNPVDEELFARLRQLRIAFARAKGLPAYAVFKNTTLAEMAALHPASKEELLEINGVGERKFEKYGEQFLAVLGGADPASIDTSDDDDSPETED